MRASLVALVGAAQLLSQYIIARRSFNGHNAKTVVSAMLECRDAQSCGHSTTLIVMAIYTRLRRHDFGVEL